MTQSVQQAHVFADDSAPQSSAEVNRIARRKPHPAHTMASEVARTHRYLLVLQFVTLNLAAFTLLGAAYMQGWIDLIVQADGTKISIAIFLIFLGGLAFCTYNIWKISKEMECVRNFNPCDRSWATTYLAEVAGRGSGSRAIAGSALHVQIAERVGVVRHVADSLVLLGLIGTVLGFIIALSGVDPNVVGDVRAIAPMVTNLVAGMSVALYTTFVGAVLNLWLTVNYHLLRGGAVRLVTALIALGERNARPRLV